MINSFDKILFIDDKIDEVSKAISYFNKKGISTVHLTNALESGVEIDSHTKLVILDLYLSKTDHEDAVYTVQFLAEKIKVPYILLVWSSNPIEQFINDINKVLVESEKINKLNFPLVVDAIEDINKVAYDEEKFYNSINELLSDRLEKFVNFVAKFNFMKIYSQSSSKLWEFINDNLEHDFIDFDERSVKLNEFTGQILEASDKAFGYVSSGKGLMKFQSILSEEYIDAHRLTFDTQLPISNKIKNKAKFLFVTSNVYEEEVKKHKPGLLLKSDKLSSQNLYISTIDSYFQREVTKNDNGYSLKYDTDKRLEFKTDEYHLIVTPDCDQSNDKHITTLILEMKIVKFSNLSNEKLKGFQKYLKGNVHCELIGEDTYVLYALKNLQTIHKEFEIKKEDVAEFKFNKEYLDKIRHELSGHLSRIGLSNF